MAEKIKRMSGVKNVLAITSAKVPIIKLFYQNLNVEADISLYNVLARFRLFTDTGLTTKDETSIKEDITLTIFQVL